MFSQTGTTAGFEPAGGGFAQYIRVMPWIVERGLIRIPREVSFDEACLAEPLNTVLKAVETLAPQRNERCVVIGAGPIGLKFTQVLRMRGARVTVLDLLDTRLALARKLGASQSLRADQDLPDLDADAVVVTVPSARAVEQAFEMTRVGGRILLFAHTRRGELVTLDPSAICVDEKQLMGSYSSSPRCQSEAARLIFQRKINVKDLITHRFPLDQVVEAIQLATHPTAGSLKIIVKPNPEAQVARKT
jgi:L-iditol 2-dehydrogenase